MAADPFSTPEEVRRKLLTREELALIDVREESAFADGHPLFAAQLPTGRIGIEAEARLPRKSVSIVIYGDEAGAAARAFSALGYSNVRHLEGGLLGWRTAGYEVFRDVNSSSKAFGELVASRRKTPFISAGDLAAAQARGDDLVVLDARRFEEYETMSIPGAIHVGGAELVWRAPRVVRSPRTTIVVNCAGRTRSILGAESLRSAATPNPVYALENGTIGWSLDDRALETRQTRRAPAPGAESIDDIRLRARSVAYRAGVRHLDPRDLAVLARDPQRTLYRFDVRSPEEYVQGHIPSFLSAPGGQLVQETDAFAPVRGARIVLADDEAVRADMTASWLAQMAWEVYVLDGGFDRALERGNPHARAPRSSAGRYRRPYEGTDVPRGAMQAYLDWEFGLEAQLERDATHGFHVI